jgi:hypothetical protein
VNSKRWKSVGVVGVLTGQDNHICRYALCNYGQTVCMHASNWYQSTSDRVGTIGMPGMHEKADGEKEFA